MVEKIIVDSNIIKKILGKEAQILIVQYNTKSKRAWFRTETMPKRKPIEISRVTNFR